MIHQYRCSLHYYKIPWKETEESAAMVMIPDLSSILPKILTSLPRHIFRTEIYFQKRCIFKRSATRPSPVADSFSWILSSPRWCQSRERQSSLSSREHSSLAKLRQIISKTCATCQNQPAAFWKLYAFSEEGIVCIKDNLLARIE